MMKIFKRKEKFVFNTHTLTYERVVMSLKDRIFKLFSFFSASLVAAILLLTLVYRFFPSPREGQLLREIEQMQYKYSSLNGQMEDMSKVLQNVQDRDAGVHRMMFGMEPIDKAVWNGGVGGHNKYKDLFDFSNTGSVIAASLEKAEKLQRQLVLQSKSLDTIQMLAKEKENMFASIPSIKPIREDKLNRSMTLLSGFGMRLHPIHKVTKMHTGIDFSSPQGTAIQATGDGRVVKVEHAGNGYGNNVTISHGYGYETLYGHMARMDVQVGEKIKKGQKIGIVGSTGTSTAPHCHYEVRYKGVPVNPVHFCLDGLNPNEYQQMTNAANSVNQSFD